MKFLVVQILNLPEMKVLDCLRVASRREEIEGMGIVIAIKKSVNYFTCPSCRKITHSIYQNHWRMIHDLCWSERTVILKINRRQFKCNKCKKVFI